jgi:hypothetical protein
MAASMVSRTGGMSVAGVSRIALAAAWATARQQPLAALGSLPRTPRVSMSTVVDHHPRVPVSTNPPPASSPVDAAELSRLRTEEERRENARRILHDAVAAKSPRHDWTREEIASIYYQPLIELSYQAVRNILLCTDSDVHKSNSLSNMIGKHSPSIP